MRIARTIILLATLLVIGATVRAAFSAATTTPAVSHELSYALATE